MNAARDAVVTVSAVTFAYPLPPGAEPVLENVTITVPTGDFLGVIGPNGGGKTTLLKVMLGLLEPQQGEVSVLGRPAREMSHLVGYVPQHDRLDASTPATVLDVVLSGRLRLSSWGFFYGAAHVDAARAAMQRVGVVPLENRMVGELSGGQRQRVLIARALAADPRVLFLDEPLAGVDVHMEEGILELLHHLNTSMPIVLVSHDIGFVSAHVKRVACLNRRLVVHDPAEISRDVINEMYRGHGPMRRIVHADSCPIESEHRIHPGEPS